MTLSCTVTSGSPSTGDGPAVGDEDVGAAVRGRRRPPPQQPGHHVEERRRLELVLQVAAAHDAHVEAVATGPCSRNTDRVHNAWITAMLWLTTTVRPSDAISPIFPRHLRWNAASPTASTSSTISSSGSRWAATANARRTYMPLE